MKYISILGSTGSIGTQTLDIVRQNPQDLFVVAIAAGSNIKALNEQIREFKPKLVCVFDEKAAKNLSDMIADTSTKVVCGMDGLIECATVKEADIVVTAVVGMIGIRPTIEAIKAKKDIALANKETLVTAGHIIISLAKEYNVKILPVDSEHSAIFQCINGENNNKIERLLLTASGGPFRGKTLSQMKDVQVEDALKHPNWKMGRKITIDSATMVNKGLEVMEAKWLFGVKYHQVEVVVQPQSLIHSMVEFEDGGIIAQLGTPDMRLPISYALFYPQRRNFSKERVDFKTLRSIDFYEPDMTNFPGLRLAYEAGNTGGSLPTVFNAANELAVAKFLDKKIGFLDIPMIIEESMKHHKVIPNPSFDEILQVEAETYEFIGSRW